MTNKIKRAKKELSHEIEGIIGKGELRNFRQFVFKGNMMQMAIAFILGAAFNSVVKGISDLLVMPVVTFLVSKTGTDWRTLKLDLFDGLSLEIGKIAGSFTDFLLMAIILYVLYQKLLSPLLEEDEIVCVEIKKCPQCMTDIHWQAQRCPNCTSKQEKING